MSTKSNSTAKLSEAQRTALAHLHDGDKIYRNWQAWVGASWAIRGEWGHVTVKDVTIQALLKRGLVTNSRREDWFHVTATPAGLIALDLANHKLAAAPAPEVTATTVSEPVKVDAAKYVEVTCDRCSGRGSFKCRECYNGWLADDHGRAICPYCDGSKFIDCMQCKGSGVMEVAPDSPEAKLAAALPADRYADTDTARNAPERMEQAALAKQRDDAPSLAKIAIVAARTSDLPAHSTIVTLCPRCDKPKAAWGTLCWSCTQATAEFDSDNPLRQPVPGDVPYTDDFPADVAARNPEPQPPADTLLRASELRVGDEVIDYETGKLHRVIGNEQPYENEVFLLKFSDDGFIYSPAESTGGEWHDNPRWTLISRPDTVPATPAPSATADATHLPASEILNQDTPHIIEMSALLGNVIARASEWAADTTCSTVGLLRTAAYNAACDYVDMCNAPLTDHEAEALITVYVLTAILAPKAGSQPGGGGGGSDEVAATAHSRNTWEYRIETVDTHGNYRTAQSWHKPEDQQYPNGYTTSTWATINTLGLDGWELVSTVHNLGEGDEFTAIFKRLVLNTGGNRD